MNIAFYTLGCKVNQFETQSLELLLAEKGHTVVLDYSLADVIVMNTCSVTSTSDQKSRRMIRYMAKTYPDAKIAVCGCLAQLSPDEIAKIEGVSLVSGTSEKEAFADAISSLLTKRYAKLPIDNPLLRRKFECLPAGGLYGHTRALLKIEDGCSNFCTYCIIPYSRGPVRSMPFDSAISDCRKLVDSGYKEVVITGIEISSYGRDLSPKRTLPDIVYALCSAFPRIRFRLGSLEPRIIDDNFCQKLSGLSNLCDHFHLSMQSGCDETLSRMHRKYDSSRFLEAVKLLRQHFPGCAITTDMIVGFPGEDENEFEKSLSFIKKCEFSSMHIFPYSKRAGTAAAKMEGQIIKKVKALRAKRAAEISAEMSKNYLSSRLQGIESVLFEEEHKGFWVGHAKNFVKVYVKSDRDLKNTVFDVKISSLLFDGLFGNII